MVQLADESPTISGRCTATLWNVPAHNFAQSYEASFVNTFNWVLSADKTKLACANDLHWLVRDNQTSAGRQQTSTRTLPR